MASRWVVPVRAKASLTSGSTPSRRPSSNAAARGRDVPGSDPQSAEHNSRPAPPSQPVGPNPGARVGIGPDPFGTIDRES